MNQVMKSPWTAVTLAIVAMTIGYTMYLKQTGQHVFAKGYSCPVEDLCRKAGCNGENDCSKHECASCPFCNHGAS